MDETTVGFVGLGRVGLPLASLLVAAGHQVVCCRRGRSEELVAQGARVAGDGTPRAVAKAADVLFTCLPGDEIVAAFSGEDGILAAHVLPPVVDLSMARLTDKQMLRDQVAECGGELLDCPISGTPQMAADRAAVIYASGERRTYDQVLGLLGELSPAQTYVGDFGAGTKLKCVANLLVGAHLTATAEAMAFAQMLGLDPRRSAELLSRSPAATSGQFQVRAPMIAAADYEGRLGTIEDLREVLAQVSEAAAAVGATIPLTTAVRRVYDEVDPSERQNDPAKLAALLNDRTRVGAPRPSAPSDDEESALARDISAREARMLKKTLYVGLSRVQGDWPPPLRILNGHLDWVQELERQNILFAAGPFVDEDRAKLGDGMFVVRAESAADAERLLASDPIHAQGFRSFTVHRWAMHEGTLSISVTFSDGSYTIS
jgi:putative dehydrogenase